VKEHQEAVSENYLFGTGRRLESEKAATKGDSTVGISQARRGLDACGERRRVARVASGAERGSSACGRRRLAARSVDRLRRVPGRCAVCVLCCTVLVGWHACDFHVGCRAYQCRIGGKCCPFRF
jgi:hypothetical protein